MDLMLSSVEQGEWFVLSFRDIFLTVDHAVWAGHSVHHSSEHYNLSTALRQSWFQVCCVVIPVDAVGTILVRAQDCHRPPPVWAISSVNDTPRPATGSGCAAILPPHGLLLPNASLHGHDAGQHCFAILDPHGEASLARASISHEFARVASRKPLICSGRYEPDVCALGASMPFRSASVRGKPHFSDPSFGPSRCQQCLIRRLGPVEWLFMTPSHHRVHHDRRVHKNFGGMFIIWDRMFGSFLDEEDSVRNPCRETRPPPAPAA